MRCCATAVLFTAALEARESASPFDAAFDDGRSLRRPRNVISRLATSCLRRAMR